MPICDAWYENALDSWLSSQQVWAGLHVAEPGPVGEMGGSVDRRRQQIRWGSRQGLRVASSNTLTWDNVQGIPGFPQRIQYLSLWDSAEQGRCWSWTTLLPITVPHGATLEIPPGIIFNLGAWTDMKDGH